MEKKEISRDQMFSDAKVIAELLKKYEGGGERIRAILNMAIQPALPGRHVDIVF